MVIHTLADDLQLVNVSEHRYNEWLTRFLGAFGHSVDRESEIVAFFRDTHPADRAIAVADKAGYLATSAAVDRDLVLPGGGVVRMAGVTGVTVDPTATRKGVLRAMMTHLHRWAVEQERPVAGLGSSEWPIYGRFGYGPSTWFDALNIETRAAGWADRVPSLGLVPRRVSNKEAQDLAQVLHAKQVETTAGEVIPPARYWDRFTIEVSPSYLDALLGIGGAGEGPKRYIAVEDRGLVAYRITPKWTAQATPDSTLHITDLLAADHEAASALWRHVLSVDLVTEVHVPRIAVDNPVRWWVSDARRLRARRHDGLWLRPLDVTTLLETRQWIGQGLLKLSVHDPEGYAEGKFRLEIDAGSASCRRGDGDPDLEMDVWALGAILLGGTSATALAHSGHIQAPNVGKAQLWDSLATSSRAAFFRYPF